MRVTKVYFMLWARDMSRAVGFYRDTFRLDVRFESPDWSELAFGDATIALHHTDRDRPPALGLGLEVDDLAEACRRLEQAGGLLRQPPADRAGEGVRLAEAEDPEGNRITLGQALPRTG